MTEPSLFKQPRSSVRGSSPSWLAPPRRCAPSCWQLQPQQPLPACAPIAVSPTDISRGAHAPASRPRTLRRSVCAANIGDGSQPLLAACRILARDDADPGREVASLLEDRSIGNRGDNGARTEDADAGNGLEPLAVRILAMLREKALVDRPNLGLARSDLCNKCRQAGTRVLGQARIAGIGDDGKQHLKAFVALCRDDAELG